MRKSDYSTESIREMAASKSLGIDEEMLEKFEQHCKVEDYSQREFESLVMLHIDAVCAIFERSRWPWKYRIVMALYWLGAFSGIGR